MADGEGGEWSTVGWGDSAGGVNRGWGGGAIGGGGQQWGGGGGVSSTSKNRPSQSMHKSLKQFELKQSSKALRALNAHWALPVYPIFEDESQKRQTKNRSSEKSHKKDRQD